jgi:hypothetical protein
MTMASAGKLVPVLGLAVAASLLTSCAWLAPSGGRPGATESAALEQERQQLQRERQRLEQEGQKLEQERRKLDDAAKKQTAANQELEERVARLHIALLEREAQFRLLTQKLDTAILEVVRTMAKLRSLESRAEAASNLAETEIALNMVERESGGRERPADAMQAEKLLTVAGQEFQKQNYGGALYLTAQAKSLLKSGAGARGASSESLPKVEGEVPFSAPVPLRVLSRTSVREGPGHNFKVSFAVAEGAQVVGHSYRGMWVRVRSDDGRPGWLLYNQIGQR